MDIWTLPGPSSFIDKIEHEIRDGWSVVARFPLGVPGGLEIELRKRLHPGYTGLEWRSVDVGCSDEHPLTVLRQRICPHVGRLRVSTAAELANNSNFQGRLLWVENIRRSDWGRWVEVLVDYAEACRNVEPYRKTVFIVPLTGDVVEEEAPAGAALACHDFRDVVDSHDLFMFALSRAHTRVRHPERRSLLAHTVAQVAQWDWWLAEQLLVLPVERVLDPADALRDYSQRRGWTSNVPRSWEMGTVDGPSERPIVHSSLLEISGESRLVRRRVWTAQAAVLLPLIEERRNSIVPRCIRYLRLPVETRDGLVDDALELDVGQLFAQLIDRRDTPVRLMERVRRLRYCRNELAHMRPLRPDDALHRTLFTD